ncbi:MAG: glycosyltransferase [Steroidobacteraceae bacterium]
MPDRAASARPSLSLIVSTYERADALAMVLRSALAQSDPPDELVVADDGSDCDNESIALRLHAPPTCKILYLRQPHEGFRLARLRNLAIAATRADFVLFIDGDMLLHPHFVRDHRRQASRGFFNQGPRLALDDGTTREIMSGNALPDIARLREGCATRHRLLGRHWPALSRRLRRLGNALISVKGCNFGFWRNDLVRVNGFNEQFTGWGAEDKELCQRLEHAGVRRQTLLFSGLAWHLAHAPAARHRAAENSKILVATRQQCLTRCTAGLDAHLHTNPDEGSAT